MADRKLVVAVAVLGPHEALRVAREAMYREMSGSDWSPALTGDKVMIEMTPYDLTKGRIIYRGR